MGMFKITIAGPRPASGETPTVEREVPFLPRVGDYIGMDDEPLCTGTVHSVQYWWPEGGEPVHIEVQVK